MPRQKKCRKIGWMPENRAFHPENPNDSVIVLQLEELEALRLMDVEGYDQQAASDRMEVSRGTFQRVLSEARRKAAEALVYGKGIRVEGGHFGVDPEKACARCGHRMQPAGCRKRCGCHAPQVGNQEGDEI